MSEAIKKERRQFIQWTTLGAFAIFMGVGIVGAPYLNGVETRLRPPGAVGEKEFLALCIKCGQCLQVCPYHSIKLADIGKGHGIGTPYIDARERGCYACEAVPCVLACPSGALDHATEKATDIRMGIAVLEFANTCIAIKNELVPKGHSKRMHDFIDDQINVTQLERDVLEKFDAFEGKQCTLCADMCPMPNPLSAIAMVPDAAGGKRPEVYDGCTGCGVCEEVCPVSQPSIVVKKDLTYEEYYKKGVRL